MTNRFPLIIDTQDGKKLKELPSGDNLNLDGSAIVNAASIQTAGSLSALSLTVNGQSLSAVAFSNNYQDLDNVPILFSGQYVDLTGKPNIPGKTFNLEDVDELAPANGDGLVYNANIEKYVPQPVLTEIDLSSQSLGDLGDTLITGIVTNRYLKFTAGAWRPSTVTWNDVTNKPTGVSAFQNDVGYITTADITDGTLTVDVNNTGDLVGSVFADDSTLLVDGVSGTVPGTLTGSWNSPGNSFAIIGNGLNVSTQNTALAISNNGLNFANSLNDETTSISISSSNVSLSTTGIVGITGVSLSVSTENTALTISNNGLNFANSLNDESTDISISSGNVNLSTTGGISVAAPGAVTIASGPIAAAVNGTTTLSNADNVSWAVNGDFSVAANNININSGGIFANTFTGDVRGSVFADDSTLIIDGVNGEIPDYVKKQDLIDIVQASTDFDDFKTRIQDLL
jgi:hypothetical protein